MHAWVFASARARALHAPASASSAPFADPKPYSPAAHLLTATVLSPRFRHPAPVPQVREGADFVSRLQTENLWVVVLEKMRKGLG